MAAPANASLHADDWRDVLHLEAVYGLARPGPHALKNRCRWAYARPLAFVVRRESGRSPVRQLGGRAVDHREIEPHTFAIAKIRTATCGLQSDTPMDTLTGASMYGQGRTLRSGV